MLRLCNADSHSAHLVWRCDQKIGLLPAAYILINLFRRRKEHKGVPVAANRHQVEVRREMFSSRPAFYLLVQSGLRYLKTRSVTRDPQSVARLRQGYSAADTRPEKTGS